MATQGPNSPGTMADDSAVGTKTWSNPDNAKVSDGVYSSVTGAGTGSHYLKATNFGFSIPSDATINGILVEIQKYRGVRTVVDEYVFIVKANGTIGTTQKAIPPYIGGWPTTEAYSSYGSSSDLWGETWDSTKINDVDFGVVISAALNIDSTTAYVDHIRMTIYYTEAGATKSITGVQSMTGVGSLTL